MSGSRVDVLTLVGWQPCLTRSEVQDESSLELAASRLRAGFDAIVVGVVLQVAGVDLLLYLAKAASNLLCVTLYSASASFRTQGSSTGEVLKMCWRGQRAASQVGPRFGSDVDRYGSGLGCLDLHCVVVALPIFLSCGAPPDAAARPSELRVQPPLRRATQTLGDTDPAQVDDRPKQA